MRIPLLLALVLLPLAVGCFSDPISRAMSGNGGAPVVDRKTGKLKDRRDQIIEAVAVKGGKILIDKEQVDKPLLSADLHGISSPGIILDAVGPLSKMGLLIVYNTDFTDADLERVRGLYWLHTVNLTNTRVTDAGMSCLSALPNLRDLYLDNTAVSNTGMQYLANLPNLRQVELSRTGVTDEGLAYLGRVKTLEKLVVSGHGITDKGIAHLKQVRNLRKLSLAGTRVTDAGVRDLLRVFPHLAVLR